LAQVALRHALDCELSASIVVSMSTLSKVERNLAALDFEIPEGLLDSIFELSKPVKNMMWFEGRDENNIPPSDPDQYVPTNPESTHSDD
jgi:L-galactose dehydrogenase